MNLSAHFTLEEATFSQTATRRGISNVPDADTIENMKEQARGMEQVRELLGHPIRVSSWYRSPKLNAAVGGAKNSDHLTGYATDFTCAGFGSVLEVCQAIAASNIAYHKLIREFDSWIHISFAPEMQRINLTIDSNGTRSGIHA